MLGTSSLSLSRRAVLALPRRRHQSQLNTQPFIQDHFVSSAGIAINLFARFFKFSLLSALGLGLTGWSIFEATHLWVESVELAPHLDEETRRWEWDKDAERWSGENGGTDPALGFRARHLLRASWIAENWGIGSATVLSDYPRVVTLNAIEPRLDSAQNYLDMAVKIAESKASSAKLRPQTLNELLLRHAAILERTGTKEALFDARSKYECIWTALSGKGPDAPRIALKLGDLNFRLGNSSDAFSWWTRSLDLLQGSHQTRGSAVSDILQSAPSSPSAQRTLTSLLGSLSAYYSTSGNLKQARQLQETALALLRSIPTPDVSTASPPQKLHSLFLLHRSSLISIHLAEVLYALRSPGQASFDYLTRAAESSERVALALTGSSFVPSGAKGSIAIHTPAPDATILPSFAESRAMRKPATGLLRDARRTAAEAWNLMGILNEKGGDMGHAVACYERAIGWASASPDQGAPGEGTLEADWNVMWANYSRARDATGKGEK